MEDTKVDIYDDIGDFDLGNEVERLNTENETLRDRIRYLEGDVEKLTNTIADLKENQETLKKNISTLYLTAKSEIDRKDRMISDLRRENDNICFRRFEANANYKREGEDNSEGNIAKKFKYDDSNVSVIEVDEPNEKLVSHSIEPGEISEEVSTDKASKKSKYDDSKLRREHFDDKHHEGYKSKPRHLEERDNNAYEDITANKFQWNNIRRREEFGDRYHVSHISRSRLGNRYNDVQRSRSRSSERNERYVENRGGRYNNNFFFRDERARMFGDRENWADNGDLWRRHDYRDFNSRDFRYEYSKSSDRAAHTRRETPPSYQDRKKSEIYEKTNRDDKLVKTDRKVESDSKVSRDNTVSESNHKNSSGNENAKVKPQKKKLKMLENVEKKIKKLRETPVKNNGDPSEKIPAFDSRLKEVSRNVAQEFDDGKKVTPELSRNKDSRKNKHSKKGIGQNSKTEDKRNSFKKNVGNIEYVDLTDEDIDKWCDDQDLIIIDESSNLFVEKNIKKEAKETVSLLEDELTNAAIQDVKSSIKYHMEKEPFQLSKDLPESSKRDEKCINQDINVNIDANNENKEKKDEHSSKKYLSFAEYRDQRLGLKTNEEEKNVKLDEKQNIDVNSDAGKSDGEHVENITKNDKKIELKKKIRILSNIDVTPPSKRNMKRITEQIKVENVNVIDNSTICSFDGGDSVVCKKEPKTETKSCPHEKLSNDVKENTIEDTDKCKNQDMKNSEKTSNVSLNAGSSTKNDKIDTKHQHRSLLKEYITNHTKQNIKLVVEKQIEEKASIKRSQDINIVETSSSMNLDTVNYKNQPIKNEATEGKIKNLSKEDNTIQEDIAVRTLNEEKSVIQSKKQNINVSEKKETKQASLPNLIEEEITVKNSKQQDIKRLSQVDLLDGTKRDIHMVEENTTEKKKDVNQSSKQDRKRDKSLTKDLSSTTKYRKPSIDSCIKEEKENVKCSKQRNTSNIAKDKKKEIEKSCLSQDLNLSDSPKQLKNLEMKGKMKDGNTDDNQFKKQKVHPFDQSLNPELFVDNSAKDEKKKFKASVAKEDVTDATKQDVAEENKDRQRNVVQTENQDKNVAKKTNADLIAGSSASCKKKVAKEKKESLPKECLPDVGGNIKEDRKNTKTKKPASNKHMKSSKDEKREPNRQTRRLSEENSSSATHKASNLNTDHRNVKQPKKQTTVDSPIVNLNRKKKDYEKRIHSSPRSGKQDVDEKKQDENRKVSDVENTSRHERKKKKSVLKEDAEETVKGVKKISDSVPVGNMQSVEEKTESRGQLKEKVTEKSVDIRRTSRKDEIHDKSTKHKEETKTCSVSDNIHTKKKSEDSFYEKNMKPELQKTESKDRTSQSHVANENNDQILPNSGEDITINKEDSKQSTDTASSGETIDLKITKFSDMKNILRGSIDEPATQEGTSIEIDTKKIQATRRDSQNLGHSPRGSKRNVPKNERSRSSDRNTKEYISDSSKSANKVKSDAKSIEEKILALVESCNDDSVVVASNKNSVDRTNTENIVEKTDENRIGNINRGQQMETDQDKIENKNVISIFDPPGSDVEAISRDRFENNHTTVRKNTQDAHYSSTEMDTKGIQVTQNLGHDGKRSPRKHKKDAPKNEKSRKESESDRKSKECILDSSKSAGMGKNGAGDAKSIDDKIRDLIESCSDDSVAATNDRNIHKNHADRKNVNDGENIEGRTDENRIGNTTKEQQTETDNQDKFENKNVKSVLDPTKSDVEAISRDRFGNSQMPGNKNTQNAQDTSTEMDTVEKETRKESQSREHDGKRSPKKSKKNVPENETSRRDSENDCDEKPKEHISDRSKSTTMVKSRRASDAKSIDEKISCNDNSVIATRKNVNRSSTDRENGENIVEKRYESRIVSIPQMNMDKIENRKVISIFDPPKSDVKATSVDTSVIKNTTPEKLQTRRRITPTPVKVNRPVCSFQNILETNPFGQSRLHLTDDGEIPVLHLEENHISNLPTEVNINDGHLINLLDTMNISNMECDIPKITCGTATNSGDSHINVSPIAGTKSLTFENIINKVTSTPMPKDKCQSDIGDSSGSFVGSVTSFTEKVSDGLTSNNIVNNVQSSAAVQRRKRRRCRMVVVD